MASTWHAITFLIYFEKKKEETLQTLQQIELHMKSVNNDQKVMKTVGNALTILGTVAAPFTGGASLVATVAGVSLNVSSSVGGSEVLSSLADKAQKEVEQLNAISQEIETMCVDWTEVTVTIAKAAVDVGVPTTIRHLLPEVTNKILTDRIGVETFKRILAGFQLKIGSLSIQFTKSTSITTLSKVSKEISTEVAEHVGKGIGKKVLLSTVIGVIAVGIDIAEIIYIWKAGDPKAIQQIGEAIEQLKLSS